LKRFLPAADRLRYLAAVVAGLLLAAAFPKLGVAGFAWVAPGAMLAAAFGTGGWRAFRIGWVAGFAHWLASLYWLLNIPVMKLAPAIGWLALSAYVALFTGAWAWLCWRLAPLRPGDPAESWSLQLQRFAASSWAQRAQWTLVCAAAWVALEMIRARLFTGFPWNLLGVSQGKLVPLIQISSVTGVYGVSFLLAWFSVALLCAGILLTAGGRHVRYAKLEVVVPLLTAVIVAAWGLRVSLSGNPAPVNLKVALIQPSIPQKLIWNPDESANRFTQVLRLSEAALTNKPDLLIWPEGVVPGFAQWDTNTHHAITNLVARHGVWLLLGSDDAARAKHPRSPDDYDVFNAAFLVSPQGEFVAGYRKQRLVIFGEYIPFSRWLPFLERWTGMGSFAAGTGPVPFVMPPLRCKTSVLICFEDVFPQLVRTYVEDDTDFLVNITNDGWFGESAAQWQQAANAAFRAVENGLPLVRCSNNGITCWIDAQGRMHDEFLPGTQDAYGAGFKVISVPLFAGTKRTPTFYRQHGDVFGWACVTLTVLALAAQLTRARRTPHSAKSTAKP
jgi:apolipoprotein N-acyltransferase